MKQTEHFCLNQWELTDRIRMEDFNADNTRIAAELDRLREDVFGLAYYVGQDSLYFQLNDMQVRAHYPASTCIFHPRDPVVVTEGIVVADHCATLTGKGATGSITIERKPFLVQGIPDRGKEVRLWLHVSGGSVTPFFNGMQMEPHGRFMDHTVTKRDLICDIYALKVPFTTKFSLRLDLDCGNESKMVVYDAVVAQL